MADITLPLGAKIINSRLYEVGARTVNSRQEISDQQDQKQQSFQERRKDEFRRKRNRRDQKSSGASQERRGLRAEDRRVMERRGINLQNDELDDAKPNKGRFVDRQV